MSHRHGTQRILWDSVPKLLDAVLYGASSFWRDGLWRKWFVWAVSGVKAIASCDLETGSW